MTQEIQRFGPVGKFIDYVTPGRRFVVRMQRTGPETFRVTVTRGHVTEQDTGAVCIHEARRVARLHAEMYRAEDPKVEER